MTPSKAIDLIVCVCQAVSESEIHDWTQLGGETFDQLQADLGVGTCCGKCHSCARTAIASSAKLQVISVESLNL